MENGKISASVTRSGTSLNRNRQKKKEKNLSPSLQEALATINTLQGILPICASCKKSVMTKATGSRLKAI